MTESQMYEFPLPPVITDDDLKKCREHGDYCPVLFEWYKYVSELCTTFACIDPLSPAFQKIDALNHGVLIGLLCRCSRLMFSNIALSHEGLFGETTSILDRCIFESCVKIIWLCEQNSKDKFTQFIADGLKTELKFKEEINKNIISRNNNPLEIEKRMLASIEHYIHSSGLTEEQINMASKLPSLFNMIDRDKSELLYVVAQKIGSHHVHGTWPSLFLHYIKLKENGFFSPRDHDCETHVNQYVLIPLLVLHAMESFIKFVFSKKEDMKSLLELLDSVRKEILKINTEVVGNDFEIFKEI